MEGLGGCVIRATMKPSTPQTRLVMATPSHSSTTSPKVTMSRSQREVAPLTAQQENRKMPSTSPSCSLEAPSSLGPGPSLPSSGHGHFPLP